MKYFYSLLLAVLCIPLAANAQFSEDFDGMTAGTPPTGWTVYNEDGLTPHTNVSNINDAWVVLQSSSGNQFAVSTSWYTPAGQSDDWMVTPQITVPATNPFLIFKAAAPDQSFADDYEVLISTTGNTPADFTTVLHSETTPPATLTDIGVDLSAYSGQQVYIAFRNVANNEFLLYIDDVEVKSLSNDDVAITGMQLTAYSATNTNNTLDITVKNKGANNITSLDIEWSDGTNTYTYSNTSINLAPYSTTTISHGTPVNYSSAVEKTINVTATSVNGVADSNTTDNSDSIMFHTVSQVPTKYVVIEEGTGTWCGYCPRGILAMEHMYANPNLFPNFIGIAVHNGDPMVVSEYDNGVDLSGYPGCNVDRAILGASVTQSLWVDFYNQRKDLVSPVDVSINATYNTNTREVTANLSANFYTNYAQSNIRLSVVVVEDHVTGTSGGYAQVNYFADSFPQDQGSMGRFDNFPNPVPASQMVYDRVGIALLGGYDGQAGSIPSAINDGDSHTYSFTYTLPNDSDPTKVSLVALVIDQNTGQILNAKETASDLGVVENPTAVENLQVYPNPASEFVNVSFGMDMPDDVNVNIYSMNGSLVKSQNLQDITGKQSVQVDISGLSAGEYLLSLSTNEGSVAKKIIVK